MREFFTTKNTEGTEKALAKLGSSPGERSRSDPCFPCVGQDCFTTEDTESTERKPEEKRSEGKKPERVSSVRSVFSVVNRFFDCDLRQGWQPCS
jgi:hypothetical protein